MPKPDPHQPRRARPEPEVPVAAALEALARLMGRAAAREHIAASEPMEERPDARQDAQARR